MCTARKVWSILWDRAAEDPAPFEIAELAPRIAKLIGISEPEAQRQLAGLLKELERMPDGAQFFCEEGGAVVPLPEFLASAKDGATAAASYPFED